MTGECKEGWIEEEGGKVAGPFSSWLKRSRTWHGDPVDDSSYSGARGRVDGLP